MKRTSEKGLSERGSNLVKIGSIVQEMDLPVKPRTDKAKKHSPTRKVENLPSSLTQRDYTREKQIALEKSVDRISGLREERDSGVLGEEIIKLAQALILCTLPYRPTKERQIVRAARLSDGSKLTVTFTAALNDIEMPFGADRDLMAWLFDKAINSETSFVPIRSANEYFKDTGKSRSGDRVKDLAERLRRLSGLVIGIERPRENSSQTIVLPMIAASHLPHSLARLTLRLHAENTGQGSFPGLENPFGIQLEERFFQDIKRHHVAIPRKLWLELQGNKGGAVLKDILTFFVYRCYSAQKESVIPWHGLREQFPQDDSNPGRLKQNVKKAVKHLRILWPEVKIDVLKEGIWVAKASTQLLPDDPTKKRIRRLDLPGTDDLPEM
jgi:hypothetical protein